MLPPALAETTLAQRCDVYLGQLSMLRSTYRMLLDHQEQHRAVEYRFNADRCRFELGAVLLRLAAARIIGCAGADVRVDRICDRCGKPHGRPKVDGFDGHVSVSHSGSLVAVAITSAGPVGLDVEAIDGPAAMGYGSIAHLVLAATEQSFVNSRSAFIKVWTRKEAVLKATGDGLRVPMTEVVVSSPQREPNLISLQGKRSVQCFMRDIDIGTEYSATVAVFTKFTPSIFMHDAAPLLRESLLRGPSRTN